jgi:hypothetical protein
MLVLTISGPAASMKLLLLTIAVLVSDPGVSDSILDTISKWISVCPTDYTNNDYDWGTDCYSSPLPTPTSPTLYDTDNNVNAITINSNTDDLKPKSADTKLGTVPQKTGQMFCTF